MRSTISGIIGLSFSFSVGVLLLSLGCALYHNWWPAFVVIFYILAPIPYSLTRRYSETSYSGSNCGLEVALFLTSVLVISAYGFVLVLAHHQTIARGALWLLIGADTVMFSTILAYFILFNDDDDFSY